MAESLTSYLSSIGAPSFDGLKLSKATILRSYQVGSYEIVSDLGRNLAICGGLTRGNTGVTESGSYLPGQEVIIAAHPGMDYAVILCAVGRLSPDRDANGFPVDTLGYPRLTGYQYGQRVAGKVREEDLARAPGYIDTNLPDVLDGEWAMSSPFGAAVAVEHFRAILRGAPFAKVECYGEEEPLLKLVGERLEQITLHREYQDGRLFNTGQQIDRKVYLPAEGLTDQPFRELHLAGIAHGGSHQFIVPQPSPIEVPEEDPARRRFGLFHEFRSYSGDYLLEAASSITLRKTCTIRVPEEKRPTTEKVLEPDVNTADEHILVEDLPRQGIKPAPSQDNPDYFEEDGMLMPFARVLEFVENLAWRGRNAANRLTKSWHVGQLPDEVAGPDPNYPEPQGVTIRSEAMWHLMPRAFDIVIDQRLGQKTFYVGTSVLTMAEDGSVVIEDAYHSQIIMSKGNIRISAAKDLILESGRNLLTIAGQDYGVRSYRHLDIASNTGRTTIKAETQLNLLGGNGGTGGVLVESRATSSEPTIGYGAQQTSGGIVLLADASVTLAAPLITANADTKDGQRGEVALYGRNKVSVATGKLVGAFGGELALSFIEAGTGAVIGPQQTVVHGLVADSVCDLANGGDSDALRYVDEKSSAVISSFDATIAVIGAWGSAYEWDQVGVQFCSTDDLGLADPLTFMLPLTSWQRHLETSTGAGFSSWSESPVFHKAGSLPPTAPFPGYTAWVEDTRLLSFPDNQFYRPETGAISDTLDSIEVDTGDTEVLSCTMPATVQSPINSNYMRGSSV